MKKSIVLVALVLALAVGCHAQPSVLSYDLTLVPKLQKLTSAVDSYVRYENPSVAMSGEEILDRSTVHDKGLLTPFGGYSVQVEREGKNVLLLICDQEKATALMEDSGCTSKVDVPHLETPPLPPCAFTLTPQEKCK